MREMAVPRLTLRIPSSKHSPKQSGNNRRAQSEIAPPQNYTPRMKLKGDAEWMKWSQRRQKGPLMDGFAGVSTSTLELVPRRRRVRPPPRATSSTSSSSSHDTTGSSEIAARAPRGKLNIQALSTNPETPLTGGDGRAKDRVQNDSDYRLASSMEARRSKVNFSSTTENFPAVDYPSVADNKRGFGDRTTVLDGAGETGGDGMRMADHARVSDGRVKKKPRKASQRVAAVVTEGSQKGSSRGRTKKKRKNRPTIMG